MGFLDGLSKIATQAMPPGFEEAAQLSAKISQRWPGAVVGLENFRETPDGPEMKRVAIGGRFSKPDELLEARRFAAEEIGDRWVSADPPANGQEVPAGAASPARPAPAARAGTFRPAAPARDPIQTDRYRGQTRVSVGDQIRNTDVGSAAKGATDEIGSFLSGALGKLKQGAREADKSIAENLRSGRKAAAEMIDPDSRPKPY